MKKGLALLCSLVLAVGTLFADWDADFEAWTMLPAKPGLNVAEGLGGELPGRYNAVGLPLLTKVQQGLNAMDEKDPLLPERVDALLNEVLSASAEDSVAGHIARGCALLLYGTETFFVNDKENAEKILTAMRALGGSEVALKYDASMAANALQRYIMATLNRDFYKPEERLALVKEMTAMQDPGGVIETLYVGNRPLGTVIGEDAARGLAPAILKANSETARLLWPVVVEQLMLGHKKDEVTTADAEAVLAKVVADTWARLMLVDQEKLEDAGKARFQADKDALGKIESIRLRLAALVGK